MTEDIEIERAVQLIKPVKKVKNIFFRTSGQVQGSMDQFDPFVDKYEPRTFTERDKKSQTDLVRGSMIMD